MKIGMLWFDQNTQADLGVRIARAAQYYAEKYGETPNLCCLHPSMLPENGQPSLEMKIEIRAQKEIRPNHFWIGIDNSETTKIERILTEHD